MFGNFLPGPVDQHNHRRAKSDCGLDKLVSQDNKNSQTATGNKKDRLPFGNPLDDAPLRRSPSSASIPEIYISGDNDDGSVSAVTRLAFFSLADFIETVGTHTIQGKKGSSGEGVSGGSVRREGGGGSSRRRSPLAARKSTGGLDAGASPYTPNTTSNSNHVTNNISNTPAVGGGSQVSSGLAGSNTPQQSRSRLSSAVHADDPSGTHSSNEEFDAGETVPSSGVSNGSGELVETLVQDDADGHIPNIQRTREALDHTQAKIQKTKDLIKEEQKARDENVNEYLKLAANADRQQLARIKAVFEKKNQKSAAYILQLQKKLENYQRRLREIETHGVVAAHRQPKEVLRDMGQGLKTVINKPKEIAHLIKNKFGSADNIRELPTEDDEERTHHGSATLPPGTVLMPPTNNNSHNISSNLGGQQHNTPSGGGGAGGSSSGHGHGSKLGSEEGSDCGNSSVTSESMPGANTHLTSPRNNQYNPMVDHGSYYDTHVLLADLQEARTESRLLREEVETIKQTLNAEVVALRESLAEERFRCERLEEQVNDLTELHQNEMENLKTTMTDMEEKVQYQSEERIRDLHEIVENCHTRISRMEHQQAQQQQQFLTLEGLENTNARAVFVKLINILLTVLQVLLLIVATVANILTPLLRTRTRIATTATLIFIILFVYIQVPELRDWLLQWPVRLYKLFSFNND
ncbi:unnamed protein product [Meganyctiphanes norvegica]|uniref:Transmembrane and coiled-coil domains protein 1 n=1 Tax=Meganyctiphanes norvegica TaxID=48144 RepID=A0AAV2QXW7_MEGNR